MCEFVVQTWLIHISSRFLAVSRPEVVAETDEVLKE